MAQEDQPSNLFGHFLILTFNDKLNSWKPKMLEHPNNVFRNLI